MFRFATTFIVLLAACAHKSPIQTPKAPAKLTVPQPAAPAKPKLAVPAAVAPTVAAQVSPNLPEASTPAETDPVTAAIEKRLADHAEEIEAAFATEDCSTILLKRRLVEDPNRYSRDISWQIRSRRLTDWHGKEEQVGHSRLVEFDARYASIGCEAGCTTFVRVDLTKSEQLGLRGTAKPEENICYRVHSQLGPALLAVQATLGQSVKGPNLKVLAPVVEDTDRGGVYENTWTTFAVTGQTTLVVSGNSLATSKPEKFLLQLRPVVRTDDKASTLSSAPTTADK